MTDRELQKLIATPLVAKLKAAGFKTGTPSNDHTGFYFPINLNMAGELSIVRYEDGVWTFRQEDSYIAADRQAASIQAFVEACERNG
jgi:hypothetical protein